jgi:tellurite resistance-related uncharacterized protein
LKQLPATVSPYNTTPTFTEDSIPSALLQSHTTKAGTWGKIVVLDGELIYRILEPSMEVIHLSSGKFGVVEPGIAHEVQPVGTVSFYVEFHRQADG